MTIVELLLALVITSLVALATGMMMVGVSYGSTSKSQMREVGVRLKTTTERLNAALRSSKMILATGTDYLVLWTGDSRADDGPNLSELRLIERDADTGELRSYAADFGVMTDAQIEGVDTLYSLTDDFHTLTTALKAGTLFTATVWAKHVTAFACTHAGADPQAASLINYRLTVTLDGLSEQGVESVALRNH